MGNIYQYLSQEILKLKINMFIFKITIINLLDVNINNTFWALSIFFKIKNSKKDSFMFLQISLMSGLVEDSSNLLPASSFNVLLYHNAM